MFSVLNHFENLVTSFDLLLIGLLLLLVSLLEYLELPRTQKKVKENVLNNPIYHSKDVLLQSKVENANYLVVEKSQSILVKGLIYAMILVVVFTPLYKLLGTDYFL